MATWYNYLLTSVAGLSNLACLYYTRKKFNTQLAQFYLMCLDSGTSALCCLAMLGANLVNELMESKSLGCFTNILGAVIALECFIVLTTLNSYVR